MTYAYYPDTGWSKFEDLKLKLIIYTMGGCLANSVLLMCLIMMLIYTGFPALRYFIYIEIVTIITNLVPTDAFLSGTKLPSDGKQIFFILTQNYQRYFFARHQTAIARIAGDRTEPKISIKPSSDSRFDPAGLPLGPSTGRKIGAEKIEKVVFSYFFCPHFSASFD
ncbi:MAG: hypothetical protein L0220_21060, partial [Acidobacteria bacterium]|nr:hypothetical protein [Acidobacteriota bacterium]